MKEALKNDRARIQVGRISSFGLMEMSRQRLRTGVLEASTKPCPHCEGTGLMRTAASAGLSALRIIEDEAARGRGDKILLRAGREAAIYLLNKKRAELAEIEERYGVSVEVVIDESFEGARMTVESSGPRPWSQPAPSGADPDRGGSRGGDVLDEDEDEDEEEEQEEEEEEASRGSRSAGGSSRTPPSPSPAGRTRTRASRGWRRLRRGRPNGERPSEGTAEETADEVRRRSRAAGGSAAPSGDRKRRRRRGSAESRPSKDSRRSSRTARRWSSGRSKKSRRLPPSRRRPSRAEAEAKPRQEAASRRLAAKARRSGCRSWPPPSRDSPRRSRPRGRRTPRPQARAPSRSKKAAELPTAG